MKLCQRNSSLQRNKMLIVRVWRKPSWVPPWKKIPTWCRGNVKQTERKVLKRHNAPLCNIGLHVREHDSAHFSVEDGAVISWRNM